MTLDLWIFNLNEATTNHNYTIVCHKSFIVCFDFNIKVGSHEECGRLEAQKIHTMTDSNICVIPDV